MLTLFRSNPLLWPFIIPLRAVRHICAPLQESPAGRPSFSEIVKALKDMATALRPVRKPRPTSSNAGSSSLSQRSSKQLSQDKAAQGAAAQQKQPGPTLAVAAKDQPSKGSSQQQKQQSGQLQDGAQQLRQAPQE